MINDARDFLFIDVADNENLALVAADDDRWQKRMTGYADHFIRFVAMSERLAGSGVVSGKRVFVDAGDDASVASGVDAIGIRKEIFIDDGRVEDEFLVVRLREIAAD